MLGVNEGVESSSKALLDMGKGRTLSKKNKNLMKIVLVMSQI